MRSSLTPERAPAATSGLVEDRQPEHRQSNNTISDNLQDATYVPHMRPTSLLLRHADTASSFPSSSLSKAADLMIGLKTLANHAEIQSSLASSPRIKKESDERSSQRPKLPVTYDSSTAIKCEDNALNANEEVRSVLGKRRQADMISPTSVWEAANTTTSGGLPSSPPSQQPSTTSTQSKPKTTPSKPPVSWSNARCLTTSSQSDCAAVSSCAVRTASVAHNDTRWNHQAPSRTDVMRRPVSSVQHARIQPPATTTVRQPVLIRRVSTEWRHDLKDSDRVATRERMERALRDHCHSHANSTEALLSIVSALEEELLHRKSNSKQHYFHQTFELSDRIATIAPKH